MPRIFNVLFLCSGNSARSIMAEAIVNRLGRGRFRGHSAGSMPRGKVHPMTFDLLSRKNHPVEGLRSKGWEEFSRTTNPDAPRLDFVITVCDCAAGEACPIWPGQPATARWIIPDPAAAFGGDEEVALAFAGAYRLLEGRIHQFASLPLESLERLTLQRRLALQRQLDEIGRAEARPEAVE
jgi:protein-tyrosine-phosphatase